MDDGVIARLATDRFHVTTTTGGAPRVLAHMEDYLQTEFTDLEVWLTSTTEQWAVIAVQGPKARETIAPLVEGVDLANEPFPHMSVRDARVCGVPARLMRVSFTGELGYEINVGSASGRDVWKAVWREVERRGGCAYGTEAMHVMRAEKGYVIVGQDTDGTVTLADLGLDWAIGKSKKDFVGKRSLSRPDMLRDDRKQLVGLLTQDPNVVLEEGAQITASETPARRLGSARSCHLVLSQPGTGALDRIGAHRRRALKDGEEAFRRHAGRRRRSDGHVAGFLRRGWSAPPCLIPGLPRASPSTTSCRGPSPRFSLADRPPATRFIFRGAESARGACSRAFNADLPRALGPAASRRRSSRHLAWPGRMAADRRGRRPGDHGRGDRSGAERRRPIASSTSRIARSGSTFAARRRSRAKRRVPARPPAVCFSHRHGDPHDLRQGGDRPVAARSPGVPG